MRKQIPFVETINIPSDAFNNITDGSELPSLNVNGFVQQNKSGQDKSQKLYFVKRPVIDNYTAAPFNVTPGTTPPGTGTCPVAAAYSADGTGSVLVIYSDGSLAGTSVFYNGVSKALPGTWAGNSRPHDLITLVDPSSGLYGSYAWAFTNFNEGAVVSSAGVITEITDADYTAWTTKTNMVAMDGYIFQGDYKTCKIWNSDLNAPTSWVATSFISANLHPGRMIRLVRVRNYLVAFKTSSIEFFKDVGNPTPGSPLDPLPELCQRYGAVSTSHFAEVSDGVIFAGFTPAKRPGIFKLNWNTFEITEISNSAIAELAAATFPSPDQVATPFTFFAGMSVIPWKEKEFVTVALSNSGYGTFIYDMEMGLWYMWTCSFFGTAVQFPRSVVLNGSDGVLVSGNFGTPFYYLTEYVNGSDDEFTTPVPVKFISGFTDFGTFNRKFLASMEIGYDINYNSTATNPAVTIGVRYIDDDNNFLSNTRSITVNSSGSAKVKFQKLGSFNTRKFIVEGSGSSPFRFTLIECDVRMKAESLS